MGRRTDIIGVTDATGSVFATEAVTVSDTATKLPTTILSNRKAISVFNMSATETVYLGNADVTTANGYPLVTWQGLPWNLGSGAQLYGICAAGKTAEVRCIEIDNS